MGSAVVLLLPQDPIKQTNNVGRNCYRILQIQREFQDAVVTIERHYMEPLRDPEEHKWYLLDQLVNQDMLEPKLESVSPAGSPKKGSPNASRASPSPPSSPCALPSQAHGSAAPRAVPSLAPRPSARKRRHVLLAVGPVRPVRLLRVHQRRVRHRAGGRRHEGRLESRS